MSKQNRTIKITFRVTEAELLEIERLCKYAGMTTSDLVRMAVLTAKIKPADIPLIDQASFVELKRIGNNINQIARGINSGAFDSSLISKNIQSIKINFEKLTTYLINYDSQN
ncbi:MAG TPA: plasmid mobilization relaxosome protein MobC [Sphingobacterium bovisgrunnientis]|nr:plasmid mobilization relaxosome protein MobC [Sphingobacterium bovisgrunnientis]